MPNILFTGGGTAGHVTPNIALIEALTEQGYDCRYVGSRHGIERELIEPLGIPYQGIHSGKLRRYFSWQNFIDPLFILLGVVQSLWFCLTNRPDLVFSKGGFVAVPVVFSAWLVRVPVICHESDITPGLANKLCLPFSRHLCVNFEATLNYLSPAARTKALVTGSPLRSGLRQTDKATADQLFNLGDEKPVLLIVGGSLGARIINQTIWADIDNWCRRYQVIHLVGAGNLNKAVQHKDYHQVEYIDEQYGDVLARADLVVSRAGANSVFELLVMQKPHVLVPLSAAASRGDQLVNARIMVESGVSLSILEPDLNSNSLAAALDALGNDPSLAARMAALAQTDAVSVITGLIKQQL